MKRAFPRAGSVVAIAAMVLIASSAALLHAGQAQGGRAEDITGKFVGFQDGVLTVNVAKGKLAGTYNFNVPDGIPVLVYTSPGHPQTEKSPGAFANAAADTTVEVTLDTRSKIIRIVVGDQKPAKKH